MKNKKLLSILLLILFSIPSFIAIGHSVWIMLEGLTTKGYVEYYPVDIDERLESVYDGEEIVITYNADDDADYDVNINHAIEDLSKEKVTWKFYTVDSVDEDDEEILYISPFDGTPVDVGEYIIKFYYSKLSSVTEDGKENWTNEFISVVSHTITPKEITITEDLSLTSVVYGEVSSSETKNLSMNYYTNDIYERDRNDFESHVVTENNVKKFQVEVDCSSYDTTVSSMRDAGTYNIINSDINLSHKNYTFKYTGTNTLTVTPRPVNFAYTKGYTSESFVYNGSTHTPDYSYSKVPGNEISGLVYSDTSASISGATYVLDANTQPEDYTPTDYYPEGHKVTINITSVNYKLADNKTNTTKSIMITTRPVNVEWTTLTKEELVYDGADNKVTPTILDDYTSTNDKGIVPGDDLTAETEYSLSGTKTLKTKNVGTYSFEAILTGNDAHNYYVDNDSYKTTDFTSNSFEVTKRPVTISWGTAEYTKTYDATNFTPASGTDGASFNNVVTGETLKPAIQYKDSMSTLYASGPKDAGTYTAYVTLPDNDTAKNYELHEVSAVVEGKEITVPTSTVSKTVIIKKKSLLIVWGITEFSKTYDNEDFDIGTTSFDGLQGGEVLTPDVKYYKGTGTSATLMGVAPKDYNSSNYEIRGSFPTDQEAISKNYYLASVHDGDEVTYTSQTLIISQRQIVINWKDGQEFTKTYDKKAFEAGKDAYFSNASANDDSKNPWVSDGIEIDVTYYQGTTKLDSAPINYNASGYEMSATNKSNVRMFNYIIINDNVEQSLTIEKRPVAVDWDTDSFEFEFIEETYQTPSYEFIAVSGNSNSGLIAGDSLSPVKAYAGGPTKSVYDENEEIIAGISANASSLKRDTNDARYPAILDGAKPYSVTFSLDETYSGTCANSNYTIISNVTSHNFYIKATPIYGALGADKDSIPTKPKVNTLSAVTYADTLDEFTHTYTYTSEDISPVGYAYKANDVNKYAIESDNLNVVVEVYGTNDENASVLPDGDHTDIGTYYVKVLTLSGSSAGSYELVGMQEGSFIVIPKVLDVTWIDENKDDTFVGFTYNKQPTTLGYTIDGVFEKDNAKVLFTSNNQNDEDNIDANVDINGTSIGSSYSTTVIFSGEKAQNYCFGSPEDGANALRTIAQPYSVYPSTIELTVDDNTDYIYGDFLDYTFDSDDFSYAVSGGNYYEASLSALGIPSYSSTYVGGTTNVGDNVSIDVEILQQNTNYYISKTNKGKLTVNHRPVILEWSNNTNLTYDGSQQIPTVEITNIAYGDDVQADITYTNTTGVNAGNHSVYVEANSGLSGGRSHNYSLLTRNTCNYAIAKANIAFTGNDYSLIYGQNPDTTNNYSYKLNTGYTIYTNAITGSLDTFTNPVYNDNYSQYDDIGIFDIVLTSGITNANYNVSYTSGKLTVNPKNITINWNVAEKYVYNKEVQGPSASFGNDIENNDNSSKDKLDISLSGLGTNAGSHTVVASLTGSKAKNYNLTNQNQEYTIEKAEVVKPAENKEEFIYNTQEQTYTLTTSDLYTISNNKRTNAGSQAVTIALVDAANYKWKDTENDSAPFTYTFTIKKAQIAKPTADANKVYTYSGSTQTFEFTSIDRTLINVTNDTRTNAGSQTVTASIKDKTNYEWTDGTQTDVTFTFKINKGSVSKPLETTKSYTYNGLVQEYVFGSTINTNEVTVSGNTRKDAGSQDVTVSLKDATNYKWADTDDDSTQLTFTFTIAKAPLTITAANNSLEYGKSTVDGLDSTQTYTIEGLLGTDEITVTYSYEYSQFGNVGNYAITPIATNDNYDITFVDGVLTVNAKEVSLVVSSEDSYTYTGSAQGPVFDFAEGSLVNNDQVTINTQGIGTNAGSHTITVTGLSSTNYVLDKEYNVTYVINKAIPTYIVPTGLKATYGQTLADVALTEGFAWNDDTLSVGEVGTHTFLATYTPSDLTNYEIVKDIEISVQVAAHKFTVLLQDTSATYNGGAHFINLTKELPAGVSLVYFYEGIEGTTYLKQDIAPTNAGKYQVTVEAVHYDAINYIYDEENSRLTAELTINKADYEGITFPIQSVPYTGNRASVSVVGLPDWVSVTYTFSGDNYEASSLAPIEVGTYTVVASFTHENSNYNAIEDMTTTLHISPAAFDDAHITITNLNDSYAYNHGSAIVPNIEVKFGTTVLEKGVDYEMTVTNNVLVGETAQITLVGKGNFEGTIIKTFEITKANNGISVSMPGWVYGNFSAGTNRPVVSVSYGEASSAVITYSETEDGEYVVWDNDYLAKLGVGVYYVKAYIAESANYFAAEHIASFSVTKAPNEITISGIDGWMYGEEADEETVTATFGTPVVEFYKGAVKLDSKPVAVGDYKIVATVAGTDNYEAAEKVVEFSITKYDFTSNLVITGHNDAVYTGEAITYELTIKLRNELVNGTLTSDDYIVSYENNINAGQATITVTGKGNFTGSASVTFNIEAQKVEAPAKDNTIYTYTGTELEYKVATSNLYTVSGTTKATNAGNYEVIITLKDKDNYVWNTTNNSDDLVYEFIINRSKLNYELEADDREFVYNKEAHTYVIGGFDNNYMRLSSSSAATTQTNAGTYNIIVELDPNYAWKDGSTADITFNFVIDKADVVFEVTSDLTDVVYDIDGYNLTYIYEGEISEDSFDIRYTAAPGDALVAGAPYFMPVGNYYINVNIPASTNYKAFEESYSLNIVAKSLDAQEIIVQLQQDVYSYEEGVERRPNVHINDGARTLTLGTDYTVVYKDNINPGTATVEVTAKGNYTGYKVLTFTIKSVFAYDGIRVSNATYGVNENRPTSFEVRANDQLLVLGTDYEVGFSNNSDLGPATATFIGLGVYADTEPISVSYYVYADISSSYVEIEVLNPENIKYTGEQITPNVVLRFIDVDGNKTTITNDASTTHYEVEYGENILPATGGTLTVRSPEYNGCLIGSKAVSFEINKADNDITGLTIGNWTYGEEAKTPSANAPIYGTIVYTYSQASDTNDNPEDETYTSTVPTNAGTYYVKATLEESDNYLGDVEYIKFVISPIVLETLTQDNNTFTYTGENITYTPNNFNAETMFITNNVQVNANVYGYDVVVTLKDKVNYVWSNGSTDDLVFDFIINQAQADITNLTMDSYDYGSTPSSPSATTNFGEIVYAYSKVRDTDNNPDNEEYVASKPTEAGNYYVRAAVLGNDNYMGIVEYYQFTVNKVNASIDVTISDSNDAGTDIDYNEEYSINTVVTGLNNVTVTGGEVTYVFYDENNQVITLADGLTKPVDAGKYFVEVTVSNLNNYNDITSNKVMFVINTINVTVSSVNVTYPQSGYYTTSTDIAEVTLTGTTNTPGTFALVAGQALTVGTKEYDYVFTPTSDNYNAYEGKVVITVYATVTFKDGSTTVETQYVAQDNSITTFPTVSKDHYSLVGWFDNETKYDETTKITNDVTLTSSWTPVSYTITYNLAGGSVATANPTSYTIESSNITLVNPTKDGYTFAGWTGTGLDSATIDVTITSGSTGNRTYTATWARESYTITYELNGGIVTGNNPTSYNVETESFTLIAPDKVGYAFLGWTGSNGNEPQLTVTIAKGSTGNKEFTANYEAINYEITYNLAGGSVATANPENYTIESDDIILVTPFKAGYTFTGWTGTDLAEPTMTVTIASGSTGNRTYTATWTANTYTITYELAGGSVATANPTTYTADDTFTLNNPTRPGYEFAGWTGTGLDAATITVTIPTGSTENRTYTATWTPITYTITYDYRGGSGDNPGTYTIETETFTLSDPTRTGYTFLGWTGENGNVAQKDISIVKGTTGNITYIANWTPTSYSITYELEGGSASNKATYTIETDTFTLNNPTKVGYTFAGWTGTGLSGATTTVTIAKGSTGDRTYTATWTPINYTIEYALDGGSVATANPTTYTIESSNITLNNPTKAGYTFAGWVLDGSQEEPTTQLIITTGSTGNRKYVAIWEIESYTINYELAGGSVATANPTTYNANDTFTLNNPTRTGYEFAGWTGTGLDAATTTVTIAKGSTGNRSYTATWTPITYTITYILNEGVVSVDNPTTYTIESNTITLTNPIRPGYEFAGWTGTGLDKATTIVTIPTGSTENRTYTATWEGSGLTGTYGQTLSNVALPDGFAWENSAEALNNVGNMAFDATYTQTNGTVINITLTINVAQAAPSAVITGGTGALDYNGSERTPTVTTTGGEYTVEYSYNGGAYTSNKPVNAGTYKIKYTFTENTYYTAGTVVLDFEIKKVDPTITVTITDSNDADSVISYCELYEVQYVINGVNSENITGNHGGTVTYKFYDKDKNEVNSYSITNLPTEVGTYYVKAFVSVGTNYNAAESDYAAIVINPITLTDDNTTIDDIPDQDIYNGGSYEPSLTVKYGTTPLVVNIDYTVSYTYNSETGIGTAIVTGKNNYEGTLTAKEFIVIASYDLTNAVVTASSEVYTGSAITPSTLTVKLNGEELSSDAYTVSYSNNTLVGTAIVTITGKEPYTGSATGTFAITQRSINTATIGEVSDIYYYTGSKITITNAVLKDDLTNTIDPSDYTISYSGDCIEVGDYTVTFTGKKNYSGSVSKNFKIRYDISKVTVTINDIVYDTNLTTQTTYDITVKYNNTTLIKDTDYTLVWSMNSTTGIITATITGKGVYANTYSTTLQAVAFIGTKYYITVEKAMAVAVSGNTVYVIPGANPTINTTIYINSGITLSLPYEGTITGVDLDSTTGMETGKYFDYNKGILDFKTGSSYSNTTLRKSNVTLASGASINISSGANLVIGGKIDGGGGTYISGMTAGVYSQITLSKNSYIISSGLIRNYGYIVTNDVNSSVVLNNGAALYMPFVVYEHRGGSIFTGMAGGYSTLLQGLVGNELTPTLQCSPFNRFILPNVIGKTKIMYGATLYGVADLYANEQHNITSVNIIGTSSSSLIQLSSSQYSYAEADFDYDTLTNDLDIYGGATINSMQLSITVDIKIKVLTVNLSTNSILFPVTHLFDVSLNKHPNQSTAIYNSTQGLKIMSGSKLTIEKGATLNISDIVVYQENDYIDNYGAALNGKNSYPTGMGDGQLIVNGTLNATNLGGIVNSTSDGAKLKVTNGSISSKEIISGDREGSQYMTVTKSYQIYMWDGEKVSSTLSTGTNNTTYTSKNGGWYEEKVINISYNLNGGTSKPIDNSTISFPVGNTHTITESDLTSIIPTREHYTFGGWYINSTCLDSEKAIGQSLSESITLYAKWNKNTYYINEYIVNEFDDGLDNSGTITFDKNSNTYGFNVETGSVASSLDDKLVLNKPTYSIDSYVFDGWYVDANHTIAISENDNGKSLLDKVKLAGGDINNITLYGVWSEEEKIKYVISYVVTGHNDNSFNVIDSFEVNDLGLINNNLPYSQNQDINNNTLQYYFGGWYIDNTFEETKNINNAELIFDANNTTTLYGRWIEKEYSVKYGTDDIEYYATKSDVNIANRSSVSNYETIWFITSDYTGAKYYRSSSAYTGEDYDLFGIDYYILSNVNQIASLNNVSNVFAYGIDFNNVQLSMSLVNDEQQTVSATKNGGLSNKGINNIIFDNCTLISGIHKTGTYKYTTTESGTCGGSNTVNHTEYKQFYFGLLDGNEINKVIFVNTDVTNANYLFSNTNYIPSTSNMWSDKAITVQKNWYPKDTTDFSTTNSESAGYTSNGTVNITPKTLYVYKEVNYLTYILLITIMALSIFVTLFITKRRTQKEEA